MKNSGHAQALYQSVLESLRSQTQVLSVFDMESAPTALNSGTLTHQDLAEVIRRIINESFNYERCLRPSAPRYASTGEVFV